jgi:hypothetical protein
VDAVDPAFAVEEHVADEGGEKVPTPKDFASKIATGKEKSLS